MYMTNYHRIFCLSIIFIKFELLPLILFSVPSPATQWFEWMACVPLMLFIVVSIDDKPQLSRTDVVCVASMFLSILCGALMQAVSSKEVCMFLFLLGSIFFFSIPVVAYNCHNELMKIRIVMSASEDYSRKLTLALRKCILANWIFISFPAFPTVYMLRATNMINDDLCLISFQLIGSIAKIYFSYLVMDAHLEVFHPSVALLDIDTLVNASQKEFLRYVFHELGVPLNTISMAVHLLFFNDTTNSGPLYDVPTKKEDTILNIRYV